MPDESAPHVPVMESEVADYAPRANGPRVVVDCTIGYGGHAASLTRDFKPGERLIGVDRDEEAIAFCRSRFADAAFEVTLVRRAFSEIEAVLNEANAPEATYILIDCGFSSLQVDRADRGFSFQKEGPLDMRMDRSQPLTAADIIASWDDRELAEAFKNYGDERFSRRIARAIVRRRQESEIATTQELADVVLQAIPAANRREEGIHPATRVFQALRIAVNDELTQLRRGIEGGLERLAPGGRMAVLSYHSLEHRIVKELFRRYCGAGGIVPGPAQLAEPEPGRGRMLTRKGVAPCAAEKNRNPRSRSAQLRVVERTP
ncbi:MAG: 16S rRNA (cytosine(1402)-N(4))-methyltransferase RsmH [bacterium]|nr:16S rRNA (cytosine(1402)-N(4))-methyltransferase RsmH [bacterium]